MKGLAVLLVLVMVFSFNYYVGGGCIKFMADYWGTLIKGQTVSVPVFPCRVTGVLLCQPAIPLALLTWVLSYII